jgi:hypothetical protein
MLTGWNGPWCPNCVLDEVSPIPAQALLGQIGQTLPRGAAGQSQ